MRIRAYLCMEKNSMTLLREKNCVEASIPPGTLLKRPGGLCLEGDVYTTGGGIEKRNANPATGWVNFLKINKLEKQFYVYQFAK